jgi:hypothetical protein
MAKQYGRMWVKAGRRRGGNRGAAVEVEAVCKILWRATENDWFEYPLGSRLLYFRFPYRYQTQALSGVKVNYIKEGPRTRCPQPPLGVDEKEVLKKKVLKFVAKGYIAPVPGRVRSLIKYFAVPKEIIGGIVQDWRTVFHAGANKLNGCVHTPPFSLPSLNSLRIVNETTLMLDHDMGKMFLNFNLHPKTVPFVCIVVDPLELTPVECPHVWMSWT